MQSNDALLYMIQQKINHRLIHTGLTIDVEITRKSSLLTPVLYLKTKLLVVGALLHLGGADTIASTVIFALARCAAGSPPKSPQLLSRYFHIYIQQSSTISSTYIMPVVVQ